MTVRVLLADDDALMRAGVAVVLSTADGVEVVGEASDGHQAVELSASLAPDVILMDVRMPGIHGIEATKRIVAADATARVLILTTFAHDEYVWGALRVGASGFLLKRASPERLIDAVRTVACGDALIDPAVTRDLVQHFIGSDQTEGASVRPGRAAAAGAGADAAAWAGRGAGTLPDATEFRQRLGRLTDRETQVLVLIAEGRSNRDIAELLVIAESTAKTHVKRILAKIDAHDRAQAVVVAYQAGLMSVPRQPPPAPRASRA